MSETIIHYRRNPDFIYRKIAEETILVPVHKDVAEMDHIFSLNEIGAFVWEQLEDLKTLHELVNSILDEFLVSLDDAHSDLEPFIGDMVEIGALEAI